MSRVLFLSLDEGDVVSRCLAADVGISAIEYLPAGGVRLVCMSVDGAEAMRKKLKSKLIAGRVTRELYRPGMPPL
ncbi:MAG TPA: hypothetical protein VHN55_09800 [Sphingomicrobium sp.]|nr:hypothetical protein [Sphingomicrobium sp.]